MSTSAFAAWEIQPLSVSEFQALNPSPSGPHNIAQVYYLLGFALLAPSAHNTVPVSFALELATSRVDVFLTHDRPIRIRVDDPSGSIIARALFQPKK